MIGVCSRLPAACLDCGAELPEEPRDAEQDGCCADCSSKAAQAVAQERADEFQWQSLEWFRREALYERQPANSRRAA